MIGQDPERRHDEAAIERADREGCRSGVMTFIEQLLHPFQLSLVVTEDQRGRRSGDQCQNPVEVAIDTIGGEEPKLKIGLLVPQEQPGKGLEPRGQEEQQRRREGPEDGGDGDGWQCTPQRVGPQDGDAGG